MARVGTTLVVALLTLDVTHNHIKEGRRTASTDFALVLTSICLLK